MILHGIFYLLTVKLKGVMCAVARLGVTCAGHHHHSEGSVWLCDFLLCDWAWSSKDKGISKR